MIKRLLDILRSLDASPSSSGSRYDIVASALIRAYRELGPNGKKDVEHVMREAIDLVPKSLNWLYGNPRLALAAELYPAEGSVQILNEMGESQGSPACGVPPRVQKRRREPETIPGRRFQGSPFTAGIPCVPTFAGRWLSVESNQDWLPTLLHAGQIERSGPNKSVASLAYHQALKKIRREQSGNDELCALALTHPRRTGLGLRSSLRRTETRRMGGNVHSRRLVPRVGPREDDFRHGLRKRGPDRPPQWP